MTFPQLLKEKSEASQRIIENYNLPKKNKALWLIIVREWANLAMILEWLQILPANFVVVSPIEYDTISKNITFILDDNIELSAFDFMVTDDNDYNINDCIHKWVVCIVNNEHNSKSLLEEFNPIKNEWNAYIFGLNSSWSIFYAIVRYLENFKFPFDNKNLVKKLFDM